MVPFQVDDDFPYIDRKFYLTKDGYVLVNVNGKHQTLQRVVKGVLPGDRRHVHHKNNDIKNNRDNNLEIVTCAENNRFKGPTKSCKSGLKGVFKLKSGKYRASIGEMTNGKYTSTYLGTFATADEAGMAFDKAAITRFAGCYLNFPRRIHQSFKTCLS